MAFYEEKNISSTSTKETTSDVNVNSIDTLYIESISSKTINKTFGREGDYIELHIYNSENQLQLSIDDFKDYTLVGDIPTNSININTKQILEDNGFTSGLYRVKLNILKNKIFDSSKFPFIIKEISSNRKEIRTTTPNVTNEFFDPAASGFLAEIESSAYFKEFSLNLGSDLLIPAVNVLLNKDPLKHELLFKTLNSLPSNITTKLAFKVVEEITDPITLDIDLGELPFVDPSIPLREPNFNIDIRQNSSIPSGFKSYDDLLSYKVTSSYENLLNKLENDEVDINIQYDYIKPQTGSNTEPVYHFENFSHFGSALERLKNFKYKIQLIEKYNGEINSINSISGSTSGSPVIINDKNFIYEKKEKLIKGLDGYEQFLYFTSGTFAWPKTNTTAPHTLYAVTSSEAKTWLGSEISSNTLYGGQLLSSSLYDNQNPYNLNKLIPSHIIDNNDNSFYVSFVNMIGHHFDHTWTHIKALSDIHNTDNIKGISKDLVYYQLKGLGIETFDQFENAELIEYILGQSDHSSDIIGDLIIGDYVIGGNSSNFFSTPINQTLVTASNDGSIPKGDITKEIWKRLYHNSPYLLKTKGTERGIKALMSCYGFPSTILSVKEYGGSTQVVGPLKDLKTADFYKTFTYQKSSLSLHGISQPAFNSDHFIKTNWSSSLTDALSSSAKTIEFRIKPLRPTSTAVFDWSDQHLFTLSSSAENLDPHLILNSYTGSDIYESNDYKEFARLDLWVNNSIVASTDNFKAFNGDFWNVFIGTKGTSGSAANIEFGAYQSNFLKNILHYTASYSQTEQNRSQTFGDPYYNNENNGGATSVFFGGTRQNSNAAYNTVDLLGYSGSFQEIKYYFHKSGSFEILSHSTLKKHALEPFMYSGNHITSSFNEVILRLPLGSNDQEDSSSFHPNIDVDFIGTVDSDMDSQQWKEIVEDHYLPTPDTVGRSWTSEKVRIDEGTIDENILSFTTKNETSTLDRQPLDYPDLGVFFSPTNEINEDIIYTLGAFRLDDYIGSPLPSSQTSSKYEDLKTIKDYYFKKVKRKYNYYDYIKVVQQLDHTLFKLIEQFVPYKANTKTGLLIEPHFLERPKFQRTLPVRDDGKTMITGSHQTFNVQIKTAFKNNQLYNLATSSAKDFGQESINNNIVGQYDPGTYVVGHNNPSRITSSKGYKIDQGTNATIEIYDNHLDPFLRDKNAENQQSCQSPIKPYVDSKPWNYIAHKSSVLLGNTMKGRKSNKYYKYTEYFLQSSSLY